MRRTTQSVLLKGISLTIPTMIPMATYAPFGVYADLEWVMFAFTIAITIVLIGFANKRLREAVWYHRKSKRPHLEKLELTLEQTRTGLFYAALAFAALGLIVWYVLPFPVAELLNYGGPVSFVLWICFLVGAVLATVASIVVWICLRVVESRIDKLNEPIDASDDVIA